MRVVGNVLSTMTFGSIVNRALHAKRARSFDQRSVGMVRQISWRSSEIDRPKVLKEAGRCQSAQNFLFPFARARAKCGQNGPPMHVHEGICVRQTPKVLRVRCSFGRAGEPTI